jgi:hypothetical protein
LRFVSRKAAKAQRVPAVPLQKRVLNKILPKYLPQSRSDAEREIESFRSPSAPLQDKYQFGCGYAALGASW